MSQDQNNERESNHSLKYQLEYQAMRNMKSYQSEANIHGQYNQSIQPEDQENREQESATGTKRKIHKKSQISNFIIKTYRILEDKKNKDIIQWTDEGNCFIVKNKDRFQNQILPKYFKHKKFSSFVRQLNMYDFHKIRKEKQIPIFKHKYFKMGCIELLHKIKRKSGDEVKDQEENQMGFIPSLADLAQKPLISTYSMKSKSQLPYPTIQNFQSVGFLNTFNSTQIDQLLQQNQDLTTSISQLTRQQVSLQLSRQRKKEKILKVLSTLTYFNLQQQGQMAINDNYNYSLRDLQSHLISDQEPYNFTEYITSLTKIYSKMKQNLKSMMHDNEEEQTTIKKENLQQKQIQNQ